MSEQDSDSGSGRKGFVRDVMRRITPAGGRPSESGGPGEGADGPDALDAPGLAGPGGPGDRGGYDRGASEAESLQDAMRFFGTDSNEFRHRLDRMLADFETLRRRYDQRAPSTTTRSGRTRSSSGCSRRRSSRSSS